MFFREKIRLQNQLRCLLSCSDKYSATQALTQRRSIEILTVKMRMIILAQMGFMVSAWDFHKEKKARLASAALTKDGRFLFVL